MAKMMKVLVGEPDNMVERFYGEIGEFSCKEPENGGYTCTGLAPRGVGARGGTNPGLAEAAGRLFTAAKANAEQPPATTVPPATSVPPAEDGA